jgi:hypothetical protein
MGPAQLIPVSEFSFPWRPFVYINSSGHDECTFALAVATRMTRAELDRYEGRHIETDQDK